MRKTRGFLAKAVIFGVVMVLVVAGSVNVATAVKPAPPRFVDNGDGTITDNETGLMWEKKTGTVATFVVCSTATSCPDPTNVNNLYAWSSSGTASDGTLFTDFLAKVNCEVLQFAGACGTSDPTTGKATMYRDWRIPTIAELRTILTAEYPNCSSDPCIDPIFGPTASSYWSSSSYAGYPSNAWSVYFYGGFVLPDPKSRSYYARAVRGGL